MSVPAADDPARTEFVSVRVPERFAGLSDWASFLAAASDAFREAEAVLRARHPERRYGAGYFAFAGDGIGGTYLEWHLPFEANGREKTA